MPELSRASNVSTTPELFPTPPDLSTTPEVLARLCSRSDTPPDQLIDDNPYRETPPAPRQLRNTRSEVMVFAQAIPWPLSGSPSSERTNSAPFNQIPRPKKHPLVTRGELDVSVEELAHELGKLSTTTTGTVLSDPLASTITNTQAGCLTRIRYEYTRLEVAQSQIRLLLLHPGAMHADIKCSLIHCYLNDGPSFEALSYTWGSLIDQRRIEINGKFLWVTTNLKSALRHLRLKNQVRKLWVDAVCVNQADIQERNHQVQEMK
jgi:hypothetical protein